MTVTGQGESVVFVGDLYAVTSITADGAAVSSWSFGAGALERTGGKVWDDGVVYSVVGKAGMATTPPDVKLATLMQASRFAVRRTSAGGAGTNFFLTPVDPDVGRILDPYRRVAFG